MGSDDYVIFPQSVGYGLVIGVGFAFALFMVLTTLVLEKYRGEVQNSEMLMTGNRSIKSGLIAAAVVSSWTIGPTLLLSTQAAYNLGVSGPFFYGGAASFQMVVFSVAAIEIKRKAPNTHTYQEIVRVRYGKITHLLSCGYSFFQQICFSTNLLINGSSIIANLTGVNRDACIVLLPLFVTIYTLFGGIKATFISDYFHSVIIFLILLMFIFVTYATSDKIGSPAVLYDLLVQAGKDFPVEKNHEGSYLTMTSTNGYLFCLVLAGAGWATASDSQLMQKALAADPRYVLPAYTLGCLCWFAIPFALATTLGLACRGLENTPMFPTYPEPLSTQQINDGLVMPIAAYALMGKIGAGGVLTMIFMACTAAYSSEVVAVSSTLAHDIYKAYFNPKATGKQLVYVSHSGVLGFFIICLALAIGLAHAGFDVSFITTVSGIIVNVNIVPMGCTLFWRKMSSFAYITGTLSSTCVALAVWIGYAASQAEGNKINLTTLSTYSALAAGNTVSVFFPLVWVPILVFIKPANFDWEVWKTIQQADDSDINKSHGLTNILSNQQLTQQNLKEEEEREGFLRKQRNIGICLATFVVLFFLVIFPLPMFGAKFIFTKWFFTGWIVVMFIWAFLASSIILLLPIWDGKEALISICKQIFTSKGQREMEVIEEVNGIDHNIDGKLSVSKEKNDFEIKKSSV
ncbi:putative urea active transporter 3 [Wickerhamomyces ciferrii]|uniref:Urea active transporter 3 n=1 Tax=Wickerhamomyces ciferrii (strain ATCC 14091 / BCRC 22168 / CBS 111 / JCM 3599 / NBRC 0793 / NRRL Y-1031 F-60-10) TaxID=1206466 RepID=K0KP94_WICCF|nr:putative urea active transporter 3 [Wickerhamomyces ciferrii]CCH47100.1 putative urea active transporter 3 [Wickerhamomyces ciferrii]